MKKFKNYIARTIKNFGKLFVFACLLLPSFAICCLLGSWTTDNYGNLVSSNLFDVNKSHINSDNLLFYETSIVNAGSYTISNPTPLKYEVYSWSGSGNPISIGITTGISISTPFTFNITSDNVAGKKIVVYVSLNQNYNQDVSKVMLNSGSSALPFEPFGTWYSSSNYDSLQENYYTLEDDFDSLRQQFDILQQEYSSLEDQANQWYLEKRQLQESYNQLANTIDNDIYSIDLVHYNTSDTLSNNYNVVYTFDDISSFVVSNSYLDFNAIKRAIPSITPPIDLNQVNGIIIKSKIDLSIAQYNMLFNAISSPDYYLGLYYSTNSIANQFVSYPLRVINDNGATYYFNSYSLYDVLKTQGFDNLFSDFTYNKLAIHLTNNNFTNFTINNIKLNSENGYNTGYSKGLLDSANTIASLQNNVNDLENQKIALNDRIETLQRQLDNNLGWHSLFFSMADTPIKVVSGFLDYEILGINLFKALLGILTALAVIWLIKHFTR